MDCVNNEETIGGEAGLVNGSSTEIIVVRHGVTDWNVLGKPQGQTDTELNEIGRKQAVYVAERLSKEPNISALYSSDLKRALKTAETIASRLYRLEVVTDKDLRETEDQWENSCISLLQKIAEKHRGRRVVVVTHYRIIKKLYKRAIPAGESVRGIRNASISIFQISKDDKWSIKLWNDQSHLGETMYLESGSDGADASGC